MRLKQAVIAMILGGISMSVDALENSVEIRVKGIDTSRPGQILVMLFQEEGFPKEHDKALNILRYPSTDTERVVVFENVPILFAIKVLHDEDEDGKVTKNWTGIIPKEGLGFSQGARITYKAPSFSSARLSFAELQESNAPHDITMRYP
ncbi:DUF2141 domain-containing protein [Enterovibrio norvegicus]|uniref:DUF2141 domain-containing protein n=1 Tax=Enterovibrio norvegicus TaxID=188144 RepID=A0A2N7LAL8_9GAMM|nr:DUF2141 domain-containing protein [Enterovibrio norvegicus]PMN91622.1 hypothetical protein BCT23_17145 [Enterovibrio norvegicus]